MSELTLSRRALLVSASKAAAGAAIAAMAAPSILRAQSNVVNLYSSRHYDTDEALYANFSKLTGIAVNRVEAAPDALIERMRAEGANSPADVFISVDAGRIERAREIGSLQPLKSTVLDAAVPSNLRHPDGSWYGFSYRARVLMYNRDKVQPTQLSTYEALGDDRWRGKILVRSSTNIYNQSLVGSILAARGEEATLDWCRRLVANFPRAPRGGDSDQLRAAAAGEGDIAIANTYYLGNILRKPASGDAGVVAKIGVFFPNQADRGTHVNISGGGLCATARNREGAQRFLEYLVSPEAQRYLAEGNDEFPVLAGVPLPQSIARFGSFKPDMLNASVFAKNNGAALQIMDRAGWK